MYYQFHRARPAFHQNFSFFSRACRQPFRMK
jgi:hypothetical protein